MKRLLSSLCILLLGMALSVAIFLVASPPRGTEIKLLPTETPAPLVVDISGAVHKPGVYELPVDSRVIDAVDAAGGLIPDAARDAVNMAARVKDGEKLVIPHVGETVTPQQPAPPLPASTPRTGTGSPGQSGPVNINTATLEQLDTLPGIGPGIAERIIEYREKNGPFTKVEQIQNVSGIGDSRYEDIKDLIVVE